jgi:hypothetical protein
MVLPDRFVARKDFGLNHNIIKENCTGVAAKELEKHLAPINISHNKSLNPQYISHQTKFANAEHNANKYAFPTIYQAMVQHKPCSNICLTFPNT